jgi:hypothetical protein
MHGDRTVVVNADDLKQLAYFAAQGIFHEAETDEVDWTDEDEGRAELGRALAMAFLHGNLAAGARGDEDLPYSQSAILHALNGALTSRVEQVETPG